MSVSNSWTRICSSAANPARFGIQAHQREVVHGISDQSVSRLHIELILDGWTVKAVNHKQGSGTTVETLLGGSERLPAGTPRQLDHGDKIHFGTVWLRYEELGVDLALTRPVAGCPDRSARSDCQGNLGASDLTRDH